MSKKRDNLFERYVDKVVLGIIGILCLWLLGVFVLGNPYAREYEGHRLGPGEIDSYIEKQEVHQLLSRLEEAPKPKIYNKNRGTGFAKKFACSISNISDDVYIPIPGYAGKVSVDSRIYLVPEIDEVSNVAVERVRSVAYVPAEVVGVDNPYRSVAAELGDIDFVTVEASFDVASLYKNFEQCFAGRAVRRDWHDKNLAKPVFAAVGLERCRLLDNGSFGEWQEVPRTKIDYLKSMLNDIPEKIDDKHTVNLLMVKFDEFYVQKDILQSEAYDFAASNENWLTPKFHREYAKLLRPKRTSFAGSGSAVQRQAAVPARWAGWAVRREVVVAQAPADLADLVAVVRVERAPEEEGQVHREPEGGQIQVGAGTTGAGEQAGAPERTIAEADLRIWTVPRNVTSERKKNERLRMFTRILKRF